MFTNEASIPLAPATFTEPQPDERANGLINNSEAPAEPARCGLPACTVPTRASAQNAMMYFFMFIVLLS